MNESNAWPKRHSLLCAVAALATLSTGASPAAGALRVSQTLAARSPDSGRGRASVVVRRVRRGLDGRLLVVVRNLDARATYEIVVQGVRIGTLTTNGAGWGRARFRTHPGSHDQFLGVDPRGKRIAIHALVGRDSLKGIVPEGATRGDLVRCCVPEDADEAPECKTISADKCKDKDGTNMGAGSCMPNPCPPPPPLPQKTRCCIPGDDADDEVECKQRTPEKCAQRGGIDIGSGRCDDQACPPTPPVDRIQCCVPEDDDNECKVLTAQRCQERGGTSTGAGTCDPDPCPPRKVRCCIPEHDEDEDEDENDIECKQRTAEKCAEQGGDSIGPGSCKDKPCAAVSTTTSTTSTSSSSSSSMTSTTVSTVTTTTSTTSSTEAPTTTATSSTNSTSSSSSSSLTSTTVSTVTTTTDTTTSTEAPTTTATSSTSTSSSSSSSMTSTTVSTVTTTTDTTTSTEAPTTTATSSTNSTSSSSSSSMTSTTASSTSFTTVSTVTTTTTTSTTTTSCPLLVGKSAGTFGGDHQGSFTTDLAVMGNMLTGTAVITVDDLGVGFQTSVAAPIACDGTVDLGFGEFFTFTGKFNGACASGDWSSFLDGTTGTWNACPAP